MDFAKKINAKKIGIATCVGLLKESRILADILRRHGFEAVSYTHLVEQRNIQALLGHRDPKSTEVYLHVSNKSIMGIRSPFDRKDGTANG